MAVVAVLLIHMDMNAVTAQISTIARSLIPPDIGMTEEASFLSSPWFERAAARAKPPRKRKMIGFENEDKADVGDRSPDRIASSGTSKAVTTIGIACEIQSNPTMAKIARPFFSIVPSGARVQMSAEIKAQKLIFNKIDFMSHTIQLKATRF